MVALSCSSAPWLFPIDGESAHDSFAKNSSFVIYLPEVGFSGKPQLNP
jgi:hypothetical protein